jgi:prepilin-type N-terminal cleavage/methylation domain-containing protein
MGFLAVFAIVGFPGMLHAEIHTTMSVLFFMPRRIFNTKAGHTLVEVLVASAILSIGMVGGYYAVTASMQARKFAHEYYVGTMIANNRIEQARELPFSQLTLLVENNTSVDAVGFASGDLRYRRTTRVTPTWGGNSNLTEVSVSVGVPMPRQSGFSTSTVATLLSRFE